MRNRLTNLGIKGAGPGKLGDGGGLTLHKSTDTGNWIYRYSYLGKRREMGLGAWPIVSLAAARKARDHWARVLSEGRDPISERKAERESVKAERDKRDPPLADLVTMVFEAKKAGLRGEGARGRWRSPLDLYIVPRLGRKPGSEITVSDLADALRPIWRKKHPTAEKAIQRTRIVLRSARKMGFPVDEAIVEAAIEMLGVVDHKVRHMEAVPWRDVPALYAELGNASGSRCVKWLILTVVRMHAGRGAQLSEIEDDVWTVPADRIKGITGKVREFRVPLSSPALEIVEEARAISGDFLFPGMKPGRAITDAAVEKALRETGAAGTPHGFRTSFRTWVQDTQVCSFDVAETILGHQVGGQVERTYARSDMLDQRRVVMEAWARFVTGQEANVVPIRAGS